MNTISKTLLTTSFTAAIISFSMISQAAIVTCLDTVGLGGGGQNASAALDVTTTAIVSSSECGPYSGNDSNSLSATKGGYNWNLSENNGVDGGWIELDKADGSWTSTIIGTGFGSTSGNFTFTDSTGFSQYLVVLKYSNVFSSFLSDAVATDWGWNTDYDNNNKYDLSHLTVYGLGTPEPNVNVPEPKTLGLSLLALVGLYSIRRRKIE